MSIKAFKGFNKDMTCRDFQYEEGKEYTTDKAKLCDSGFHACERPIDCLGYYAPADSVYREVELDEVSEERSTDSKVCGKKIKIGAELSLSNLVEATFQFNYEKSDKSKEKHATGESGAASATGDRGAASATGDSGAASATGDSGAASAGHETAVAVAWGIEGKAKGVLGAHIVCAEWAVVDNEWKLLDAKIAQVDGETIKADTWYRLKDGEFVETE